MKKAMKQSTLMNILNFGSIALVFLACVAFALNVKTSHEESVASDNRFNLTLNANRFMNGSASLTTQVRSYAATGEQGFYDAYWNEINTLKNRDIGVANIKEIGITAQEQEKIDAMSALSNALVPLESAAMDDVVLGNTAKAIEAVFGKEYETTIGKIRALQTEFLTMLDTRANAEVLALQKKANRLQLQTALFLALVVIFQLISNIILRRRVMKPIIAVQHEMIEISNAHLSTPFPLTGDSSEIGMLIHSMHTIKDSLNNYISDISKTMKDFSNGNFDTKLSHSFEGDFKNIEESVTRLSHDMSDTLRKIKLAADQVSSGSNQVSYGAQALAQGATEQASSIDMLSASITELTGRVKQNADNSASAVEMANTATCAITSSNEQMTNLVHAMGTINAKSSEISKIIKTIEDIAFQTNLLALNAAVEAARAGTAGKGFAVVADEVRNLAGKSAEAAKNTTDLINDSVRAVRDGVMLAEATAKDLVDAVEKVDHTTTLIKEITSASSEQASAIGALTTGIEQVAAVVQTNAATSEESAAASEELLTQANLLKELVSSFQLQKGTQ